MAQHERAENAPTPPLRGLRGLRQTGVEIGSIVGASGNGIQDARRYNRALAPTPPAPWFIANPGDYLRRLTFDPRTGRLEALSGLPPVAAAVVGGRDNRRR